MHRRVLFARIGWIECYAGATNDPPEGQMGYIKDRQGPVAERFNFAALGGKVYGYVTHTNGTLYNLGRIDAAGVGADSLDGVLLVFMAARPRRIGAGQCVVGWYRDARLYDGYKPRPHLTRLRGSIYCAVASPREAFLLPVPIRTWKIPTGRGGTGRRRSATSIRGSHG